MSNVVSRPPIYDQEAVQPMRDELIAVGFEELLTPEQVDKSIDVNDDKTVLVMINSVCGSAAESARPGVSLALQHHTIPDKFYTGFAGQERDAVERIRQKIKGYPPSSPSISLFKNGTLIYFMPRYEIKGIPPEQIANMLIEVFDEYCSRTGPSINPGQYAKVEYAKTCGSKIPLFKS